MTAPEQVTQGRLVAPRPATKPAGTAQRGFGTTLRVDRWSLRPLGIALGLTALGIYAAISAILLTPYFGFPYEAEGYLSPFFGIRIGEQFLPGWFSPAILVLWIQLGYRATCYYFRGAYYKAFFADPPACAVGEPTVHRKFGMENRFPLILQNLHRIFLYLAFIPLFLLWVELPFTFHHDGHWRIGLGSVLLLADVVLLSLYVFSCHSLRHLVGGRIDCYSCTANTRARHSVWQRISRANVNHGFYAWASLISIVLVDIYIRLLAQGAFSDPAIVF